MDVDSMVSKHEIGMPIIRYRWLAKYKTLCKPTRLSLMTFASVSKGEGPSGGLLCDCDIFMNLRLTFVWSSTMDWLHVNPNLQLRRLGVLGPENDERYFTMLVRRWELSCFNVKFFILCVAAFKLHGTVHSDVAKKYMSTCNPPAIWFGLLTSWQIRRNIFHRLSEFWTFTFTMHSE